MHHSFQYFAVNSRDIKNVLICESFIENIPIALNVFSTINADTFFCASGKNKTRENQQHGRTRRNY